MWHAGVTFWPRTTTSRVQASGYMPIGLEMVEPVGLPGGPFYRLRLGEFVTSPLLFARQMAQEVSLLGESHQVRAGKQLMTKLTKVAKMLICHGCEGKAGPAELPHAIPHRSI